MKEIPLLILASCVLLCCIMGLSMIQGVVMSVFVCAVYVTGRRVRINEKVL